MGQLHYGGLESFEFDDHTLTHLRTVILGKMNLQESLVFTWVDGAQQHSVWLHPSIPIHFEFDSVQLPDIDPEWLERLLAAANSPTGLHVSKTTSGSEHTEGEQGGDSK